MKSVKAHIRCARVRYIMLDKLGILLFNVSSENGLFFYRRNEIGDSDAKFPVSHSLIPPLEMVML